MLPEDLTPFYYFTELHQDNKTVVKAKMNTNVAKTMVTWLMVTLKTESRDRKIIIIFDSSHPNED